MKKVTFMRSFKTIPMLLTAALACLSLALGPTPTLAAGCTSGQLIKGSGAAVYYCGADGKRYVFANSKVYYSWYSDFSGVQTISDSALASITIGGNVTYKPGTRLVKITSDPTVYVVDAGGVLRPIASENAAAAIYGAGWNKMVDDLPDAFFVNYRLGDSVYGAAQFSRNSVMSAASNINVDKGLAAGSPTSSAAASVTLGLSPSVSVLASGQSTTVTVSASDPTGISTVSLFLNGGLLKACSQSNLPTTATCTATLYGGDYADATTLNLYGQEVNRNAERKVSATKVVTTSGGTGTTSVGSVALSFSSNTTTLNAGESLTVTVTANDTAGVSSVSVYVNGAVVQTCGQSGQATSATCSATIYGSNYPSGSNVAVYGQEVNKNGTPTISATTNLTVLNGSSTSGYVTISFLPNVTTLATDGTLDVNVQASNVALGVTDVSLYVNGARLQGCSASGANRSGSCRVTINGSNYASGATLGVYGRATDTEGTVIVSPTTNITITAGASTNSNIALSFSPYANTLPVGQTTTVSVSVTDSAYVSSISIYANDSVVKTCSLPGTRITETCSVVLNGSNYAAGSTIRVYAQVTTTSGRTSTSSTSTLTVSSASVGSGSVSLFLSPQVSVISGTQAVTVTVMAYDPIGLSSVNVFINGANVRACSQSGTWPTGASCTYVISAANYAAGTALSIYGQGVNTSGASTKSTTSLVTVN